MEAIGPTFLGAMLRTTAIVGAQRSAELSIPRTLSGVLTPPFR